MAEDTEHRLAPGRLASIIDVAASILEGEDLEVEVEYQDGLISQYPVESVKTAKGALLFHLTAKNTDCLAKERCGLPTAKGECCFGNRLLLNFPTTQKNAMKKPKVLFVCIHNSAAARWPKRC